jgi:hypothetical protein
MNLFINSRFTLPRRSIFKRDVATKNAGLCLYPINLKMLFLRVRKVLETRQRLEALVIPKRQALTQFQAL